MSRPTQNKGHFTDDEAFEEFIKRATKVAQHPETAKVPPTLMVAHLSSVTGESYIEVPEIEPISWQHLALLVRPLAFLEKEPTYLADVLNLLCKNSRADRNAASDLRKEFLKGMKEPWIIVGTAPGQASREPAPDGKPRLISVSTYDKSPVDPMIGYEDVFTGNQLAEIYLNGQLFHANPNQVNQFNNFSTFMKSLAEACAKILVRGSAYYITRGLRIVEQRSAP